MNDGLSHAVVLSGGSSQGAYHVGVLRALLRGDSPATGYKPLRPDVFSGTSAGAVNAAALLGEIEAGNPDPVQHLEDYWLSRVARTGTSCGNGVYRFRGNPLAFADLGCLITNPLKPAIDLVQDTGYLAREAISRGRSFLTATLPLSQRLVDQIDISSFVAMDPFESVLSAIKFDRIPQSDKRIRIGAVRWDTGYTRYFENGDLTTDSGPKIVQGAAAVPGFFPRVKVNGIEYSDGGLTENSPLQGAVEANADIIHVVTSLPRTANIPTDLTRNSLDTLYRMLVINVTKSLRRDIERYRNVNDALLVMEKLRIEGAVGPAYSDLRQILNRILRQEQPNYRRMTIHVHKPPEPMANLTEFFNFDREYLTELIRKGYYDTVAHNCKANGCVIPDEQDVDDRTTQPASHCGDERWRVATQPGITF